MPAPALACPDAPAALHAAIARNLTDDAALLDARCVKGEALEATPDQVAALSPRRLP